MASTLSSHFSIENDSIVSSPVPISPFIPGSGNVFPKLVDRINETSWELWYFDGYAENGQNAITISFFRDATALKHGGFRVQVNILWPDSSTWGRELYFPESIVTTERNSGDVLEVWRRTSPSSSASFQVSANSTEAQLTFEIPGEVNGTMHLSALPGDTGLDTDARLGPSAYYLRPIGRAVVWADMKFHSSDGTQSRVLSTGPDDGFGGGMDRVWAPLAWPQIMTESFYLRARVGP